MASTLEMRFLARCLFPDRLRNQSPQQEYPGFDWGQLLLLAGHHGMVPALTRALEPANEVAEPEWKGVPLFATQTLRLHRARHGRYVLEQTAALVELQHEFARQGLPVVCWKGLATGLLLYGSSRLRDFADHDFLARQQDVPALLEITQRLGYQLRGESTSLTKDLYVLLGNKELGFYRDRDRIFLEFHLEIMPPRFAAWQNTSADIERATVRYPIAGTELLLQRPEDMLVSLCAHATKHFWERMKWSCDIARLLHLYGASIDWPALLSRLSYRKASVLLGLQMAHLLFDIELPSAAQEALPRHPEVQRLAAHLADHMMRGSMHAVEPAVQHQLIALLCPRLRDRLAYRVHPIVELNYEDLVVPVERRSLFFLNYGYRGYRLLRKYGVPHLASRTISSVRQVR